ncbi:hypothetical protein FJY63_14000, partial [Candidatus Sumerlaeota bacterium]|nr:hypothetical protein [Candidatus Sumerlaeota bacterium]
VEMTRKRVRQSLKGFFFADCPVCGGSGEALTREQVWRNIRRDLVSRLSTPRRPSLEVKAHPSQREYIQSEHGDVLRNWQSRFKIEIRLVGEPTFLPEQYQLCELPRKTEPQGPGRSSPRLVEVSQQPAIAVADQTPSTS